MAATGFGLLLVSMVVLHVQVGGGIPSFLYFAVASVVGTYTIDCTVKGRCQTLAWTVGYTYAVMGLLMVVALGTSLTFQGGWN